MNDALWGKPKTLRKYDQLQCKFRNHKKRLFSGYTHVCLHARLPVSMYARLSVCLPARLTVSMSARLSVCLSACQTDCLHVYPSVCLPLGQPVRLILLVRLSTNCSGIINKRRFNDLMRNPEDAFRRCVVRAQQG